MATMPNRKIEEVSIQISEKKNEKKINFIILIIITNVQCNLLKNIILIIVRMVKKGIFFRISNFIRVLLQL